MPSTIAIAKNYFCFKLPLSDSSFSLSSVPFPWLTHTPNTTTANILPGTDTDTDKDAISISEESPLLPHRPQPQEPQNKPQSLKEKYGTCTTILHYGTSSSIRLYTTNTNTPKKEKRKKKEAYVLKTLRPTPSSTKRTLQSTLESILSSTLHHPHLLQTIDILPNSRGETCLVSEYCELGDLGTYICSKAWEDMLIMRERGKDAVMIADRIFYQIMSALEFLHEMGVVHGGVCVENVFLSWDCPSEDGSGNHGNGICVKLGDLGDARVFDSREFHGLLGHVGEDGGGGGYYAAWKEDVYPLVRGLSMGIRKFEELEGMQGRRMMRNPYLAPEILSPCSLRSSSIYCRQQRYTCSSGEKGRGDPGAVDIWAAGIIYLVLRLGRILWRSASEDEDGRYAEYLAGRKRREGYSAIEGLGEAQCKNVVYAMLNPDANRRIKASEVMRSEWMYNLDLHQ
ncbi:kinase-like protein [Aspergillus niger ATCC 13496]|uniref:non-specific serine/threonine protein kinase n=1 Tax=Aspergillus niger ATCC 13496 TaxID=1353008 RepID=A0A370C8T0_ASPNG|nr:kinase-like protein [Aspergillus niger ATCC 13496]